MKGVGSEIILTIGILIAASILMFQFKSFLGAQSQLAREEVVTNFAKELESIVDRAIVTRGNITFIYYPPIKKYRVEIKNNVVEVFDKISNKSASFYKIMPEIVPAKFEDSDNITISKLNNKIFIRAAETSLPPQVVVSAPSPQLEEGKKIYPIIYLRDDWDNKDWNTLHPEWGETGGWWEQWKVGSDLSTADYIIYQKIIPYIQKAQSINKKVGVGIWFTEQPSDKNQAINFVKKLNAELKKYKDTCQFFVIAGGSQYGEFVSGTEALANYLIDIFDTNFDAVPWFVQCGTANCGSFSERAKKVSSGLMGVKANGLHVAERNEYLWRDNVLIGGMLGFSKLYHEQVLTSLEHKAGWSVEQSYDVLMKGLSNNIDFLSLQPTHNEGIAEFEKKYGFPLFSFIREHLGIRKNNAKDAWIILREPSGPAKSCYTTYDGHTICEGPQPDDYQFYLSRVEGLPNTSQEITRNFTHPYISVARKLLSQNFMYFNVEDELPFISNTSFTVKIMFWDKGTDSLSIEYKNSAGSIIKKQIIKNNTNQWIEREVILEDALLNNGFYGKADFRINSEDGDEYIHRIILKPTG
jgi:hypothetical protein